jgi:hypothetical protein
MNLSNPLPLQKDDGYLTLPQIDPEFALGQVSAMMRMLRGPDWQQFLSKGGPRKNVQAADWERSPRTSSSRRIAFRAAMTRKLRNARRERGRDQKLADFPLRAATAVIGCPALS